MNSKWRTNHLKPRRNKSKNSKSRTNNKWKDGSKHYYLKMQDAINGPAWTKTLDSISSFRTSIQEISGSYNNGVTGVLDELVLLVNLTTKFYDSSSITVVPNNKVEAVRDFLGALKTVVRRDENIVFSYRNMSKPGEEVTDSNLCIGEAYEVKPNTPLGQLVKEYNGTKYRITVAMTPISKWKKGRARTLVNKQVRINVIKIIEVIKMVKNELTNACDKVLEEE